MFHFTCEVVIAPLSRHCSDDNAITARTKSGQCAWGKDATYVTRNVITITLSMMSIETSLKLLRFSAAVAEAAAVRNSLLH